jgi:hypothetical protein
MEARAGAEKKEGDLAMCLAVISYPEWSVLSSLEGSEAFCSSTTEEFNMRKTSTKEIERTSAESNIVRIE